MSAQRVGLLSPSRAGPGSSVSILIRIGKPLLALQGGPAPVHYSHILRVVTMRQEVAHRTGATFSG